MPDLAPAAPNDVMPDVESIIDAAWEDRGRLSPDSAPVDVRDAIREVIQGLDRGRIRVAEKLDGVWTTHAWIKKAVLLSFRIEENREMAAGDLHFWDKVPLKQPTGLYRAVPPATVRQGAFIARSVILMPSYVNIGAYVDEGTMIDTWATVGSCAQVGKNVHLSGGAGLGGVLEPLQANPTIIEDDVFVGARSEIVEGVVVEQGAVISMGVYIGASTRIYDRSTGQITFGRVPAGSVVVSGSLPAKDGSHSLYAAIIVKRVDAQTRSKLTLNELLREA